MITIPNQLSPEDTPLPTQLLESSPGRLLDLIIEVSLVRDFMVGEGMDASCVILDGDLVLAKLALLEMSPSKVPMMIGVLEAYLQ